MFFKNQLILITLFVSSTAFSSWNMNDVTILFPLPQSYSQNGLLFKPTDKKTTDKTTPADNFSMGELLPLNYVDELFKTQEPEVNSFSQTLASKNLNLGGVGSNALFSPDFNNGEDYRFTYPKLRVVGMRIDPCFKSNGQCLPQIRLVWQPLSTWGSKVITDDAAIHSFYLFEPQEFKNFLTEYSQILEPYKDFMSKPQNLPLQINPILRQEGLSGPLMNQLKALTLKYCGARNIWRLTAMKTFVGGDMWSFFGYDVIKGPDNKISSDVLEIPRVAPATIQIFRVSQTAERNYNQGSLLPRPEIFSKENPDQIHFYLQDSFEFSRRSSKPELLQFGKAIARIENPDIHSPESMDCLSCHAANTAGKMAQRDLPWLNKDPFVKSSLFNIPQEFTDNSSYPFIQAKNLRALGYFEATPVISNRVRNETYEVLRTLLK